MVIVPFSMKLSASIYLNGGGCGGTLIFMDSELLVGKQILGLFGTLFHEILMSSKHSTFQNIASARILF